MILVVFLKNLVQTTEEDLEDIVFGNDLIGQDLELFVAQDVVSVSVVLFQDVHHLVDKVRLRYVLSQKGKYKMLVQVASVEETHLPRGIEITTGKQDLRMVAQSPMA